MEKKHLEESSKDKLIGKSGEPIFALAFPGGLFDTTMQLGVTHAFLISERRPPDIIVGVSTGVLQATAFAEVLQAGQNLNQVKKNENGEELIKNAQIARFREFLNSYREIPRELQRAFFPDPLEISSRFPLATYDLPIHSPEDREPKQDMMRSLSGFVGLLNDMLGLTVTVHHVVQAVHRWLRLAETGNIPSPLKRYSQTLVNLFLVLIYSPWNLWRLSGFAGQIIIPGQKYLKAKSVAELISTPLVWKVRLRGIRIKVFGCIILYFLYALAWVFFVIYGILFPINLIIQKVFVILSGKPFLPSLKPSLSGRILVKIFKRLLVRYDLLDEITSHYPLRKFLIRVLDPKYYGELDLKEVVEKSISQIDEAVKREESKPKRFFDYSNSDRNCFPIKIVPVAVNIKSGLIEFLPENEKVVDTVLAAMALPPWFKPVTLGKATYIDAAPLTEVPIPVLVEYLKNRVNPESSVVNVFAIHSIPTKEDVENIKHLEFTSLGDIAKRTFELQRHQHTKLVHRLTNLYTKLLPEDRVSFTLKKPEFQSTHSSENTFVAAQIFPIAPQEPLRTNHHLLAANSPIEQEEILLYAVATGCRNALEMFFQTEISSACEKQNHRVIKCETFFNNFVPKISSRKKSKGNNLGPGVPEVCKCCTIVPFHLRGQAKSDLEWQVLQIKLNKSHVPKWPHKDELTTEQDRIPSKDQRKITVTATDSPKQDPYLSSSSSEPWITLLLNGGVFRGVFQIGVLNGFNEAGIKPTLFAGSSVGSIVAAMAARLSTLGEKESRIAMQEAAATFLSLDRLVVTDRFADFIRRFTIRANDVNLSLNGFDKFLRQFDYQPSLQFNKNARVILAGLERLFYVSPFEFLEFARALHNEEFGTARSLLWHYIDVFFERHEVGIEILGAEPLRMLIEKHVLPGIENPSAVPFDYFKKHGKYLIATATNLTKGELHVFGMEKQAEEEGTALLIESLLASSAFPAVFRPRRHSEIYPHSVDGLGLDGMKFVDGGITDNLPLDAVITFMHQQAKNGILARRPSNKRPHLLLTASLEPKPKRIPDEKVEELKENWILLMNRIRELQFNRKIHIFEQAQKNFRRIYQHRQNEIFEDESPLDLAVGTVIPNWMCNTFGFHAMLGFRHYKQAANIAHGCAMAFGKLVQLQNEFGNKWEFSLECEDEIFVAEPSHEQVDRNNSRFIPNRKRLNEIQKESKKRELGYCWFRKDALCPFSSPALDKEQFGPKTLKILPMIYEYCGRPETHETPN